MDGRKKLEGGGGQRALLPRWRQECAQTNKLTNKMAPPAHINLSMSGSSYHHRIIIIASFPIWHWRRPLCPHHTHTHTAACMHTHLRWPSINHLGRGAAPFVAFGAKSSTNIPPPNTNNKKIKWFSSSSHRHLLLNKKQKQKKNKTSSTATITFPPTLSTLWKLHGKEEASNPLYCQNKPKQQKALSKKKDWLV